MGAVWGRQLPVSDASPSETRHKVIRCLATQLSGLNDKCEIILGDGVTLGDM